MVCDLSNPIVTWHFTGDTNDSSGNGNNGTNSGATLTNDKNSVSNQAYDFDGISDKITLSNLNITSGEYSIVVWAKSDVSSTSGDFNTIVRWADSSSQDVCSTWFSGFGNNLLRFRTDDSIGTDLNVTIVGDTNWHMYVFTFKENGFKRCYEDGILLGSQATGTLSIMNNNNDFVLGNRGFGGGEAFDGVMDELNIFPRELDQDTIDALFDGYDNPTCVVAQPSKSLFFSSDL